MKKRFSATEFLKQAMESEEQPKVSQVPQTKKEATQPKEERYTVTQKPEPTEVVIPSKTDALKIDKNFYKVPNAVDDLIVPTLSAAEEVIYRRLIRMSWGWGKNYCRAGVKYFQETSSIKSRTTIKSAIDGLIDKKIIYRYIDGRGQTDRNQNGTVYIIPIPSIPDIGIPKNGTHRQTTDMSASKQGGSNIGIPKNGILNIGIPKIDTAGVSNTGIPENGTPKEKLVNTREKDGVPKNGIPKNDPIKDIYKDSLKDTLSPREIVSAFYKGIGQQKITAEKRERAENNFKELLDDGFKPEDIQFAVEWTLKNAKEELYDFSIIKHTIGQAMAAKRKVQANEAKKREREKITAQKEAEEKRRSEEESRIRDYKEGLSKKERAALRQRALEELENTKDLKKEFINDILIAVKENELLKLQMEQKKA
jgi:hypothetical protein